MRVRADAPKWCFPHFPSLALSCDLKGAIALLLASFMMCNGNRVVSADGCAKISLYGETCAPSRRYACVSIARIGASCADSCSLVASAFAVHPAHMGSARFVIILMILLKMLRSASLRRGPSRSIHLQKLRNAFMAIKEEIPHRSCRLRLRSFKVVQVSLPVI